MNTFTKNAIKVILSVPKGKVLSYGHVALLTGSPRGARQVAWILSGMSDKYNLPWHRIVNSKRQISMKDPMHFMEQKSRLENEGVVFDHNNTIDKSCLWTVDFIDFDSIDIQP